MKKTNDKASQPTGETGKSHNGTAQPHEGKGFLALAGEALHVLGEEIVHGKDKVVEVTAAKFTVVKKAIRKFTHKKAAKKNKVVAKKVVAKKVAAKKVAAKKVIAKKVAPKAPVAKKKAAGVAKKTAPKKKR
jgi:hypothetical protein